MTHFTQSPSETSVVRPRLSEVQYSRKEACDVDEKSSTEVIDEVIFCGMNVTFLLDLEMYTINPIFSTKTFSDSTNFYDSHSKSHVFCWNLPSHVRTYVNLGKYVMRE